MPELVYKDPYIKVPQWHEKVPLEVEPFQYKTPRTQRIDATFDRPTSPPDEMLTGYVHGEKASVLEERFAIALDFFGLTFIFQYEVPGLYTIPGEGKLIDFIVYDGGIAWPVEIGSSFVHASPSKQEEERARMQTINEILPMLGIMALNEDESYVPLDRPDSIDDAKDIVASMFISL